MNDIERVRAAAILLLLNAAFVVIAGLWAYFSAADLSAAAYEFEYYGIFREHFTQDGLTSFMEAAALTTVAGGLIGIAAALLAFKRRRWHIAMAACLISALLGAPSLFGLIIGLIAFRMLWKSRSVFAG